MTKKELLETYNPGFSYKLPIKFKQKWVESLRKEEYAQVKRALVVENEGYCCLGVAAKVCEVGDHKLYDTYYLTGVNSKRIPKILRENKSINTWLSDLNDLYELTFPQIAMLIEKYL